MGRIQVLPEQVANQIAAGEVVERPASVVKELVENALDAGASRISVALEGGGADMIRVADNGVGMSHGDALLSIERHATSKVRIADDLRAIHTFGFRGEALPSIASVSRMDLTTSNGEPTESTRVSVDAGKVIGVEPAPHPRGTTVAIRGLFHNAPARRKFLRSRATESAHVADVVARIAAAHPGIAFELSFGGREQRVWPAVDSYRERIAQIVGADVAGHLVPVDRTEGSTRVQGMASKPALHRSTSRDESIFVNARPIRDRRLLHAVQQAYATLLPKGRYPVVHLFINVPSEEIDVNVHPAKSEVRFLRGAAVHDLVVQSLLEALGVSRPFQHVASRPLRVSEAPPPDHEFVIGDAAAADPALRGAASATPAGATFEAPPGPGIRREPAAGEAAELPLNPAELTPLAQFNDTYLLASSPDGLVIVDQHAAHERVLYERLLASASEGKLARQSLLFPVTVEVSDSQRRSLEETLDIFRGLGIDMVPFGPTTIRIDAIPALLENIAVDRLVRDVLDEILDLGRAESVDRLRSRLAATAACHAAVRANQTLPPAKMRQILADLGHAKRPMTCPHGRPVLLRFPLARLEREFGRR